MSEKKEIIKLIKDLKNNSLVRYSMTDAKEAIRKEFIELNGGKTKLSRRDLRDAEYRGMFRLLEDIITEIAIEGLDANHQIFNFVDFRNVAKGDELTFKIKGKNLFLVSKVSPGNRGLRRQRIDNGRTIAVETVLHGVKIYDELDRLLAGRVDILELIDSVSESITKKFMDEVYDATVAAFDSVAAPYMVTGEFKDNEFAELIMHVEAATGKKAIIMGSKIALRKIKDIAGADSNSGKEDLYNLGYFGRYGTNAVFELKNAHKVGTDEFILGNDLYVVAGDDKFIKAVHEGETLIGMSSAADFDNADLTEEYMAFQEWGIAVVFSEKVGVYKLS